MNEDKTSTLTELTVELLSAFVANNSVRSDDLPALIAATHAALAGLDTPVADPEASTTDAPSGPISGAVTARKSLGSPNHIISMIDGKPYTTLKRHLAGHGLTPETYRSRFGLPSTYPMVAPAYSEMRREMAKRLGLGRKPASPSGEAASKAARAKPGRKPRAVEPS